MSNGAVGLLQRYQLAIVVVVKAGFRAVRQGLSGFLTLLIPAVLPGSAIGRNFFQQQVTLIVKVLPINRVSVIDPRESLPISCPLPALVALAVDQFWLQFVP